MATAIRVAAGKRGILVESLEAVLKDPVTLVVDNDIVAIHVGSGRELPQLINLCRFRGIPLIQGSTNCEPQDYHRLIVVEAPNFSLPMIRFIGAFPDFARALSPGMGLAIVESHQAKKADVSGTARAIASLLDLDEHMIISERDPDEQRRIGVPEEYLGGHALHFFALEGSGVQISIATRIFGRETYALGALDIAVMLVGKAGRSLPPDVYPVTDILKLL